MSTTGFFGVDYAYPEVRQAVEMRLEARHERYQALADQYATGADAARDDANASLADQLREIEREFGRAQATGD